MTAETFYFFHLGNGFHPVALLVLSRKISEDEQTKMAFEDTPPPSFRNKVPQFNKFVFYDLTRDVPIGIFGVGDHQSWPREAVSAADDTDQLTIGTADTDQEVYLYKPVVCFLHVSLSNTDFQQSFVITDDMIPILTCVILLFMSVLR